MELQVGVKAVLKNKEGKYLLLRRSRLKYPDFKGAWDIVGGRIDPGTTLLENLKREVKEETSLDLNDEKLELIAAQDILRIQGKHVVRLTYVGGEVSGEPTITDEHEAYGWFTLDEIKQLGENELDVYFKKLADEGLFDGR